MAELPRPELRFDGGCPDCGGRRVRMPEPPPAIPDDLDWRARDFEGFRAMMLADLARRLPERGDWNPADLEVVLVEVLATQLDWLSDMHDRVTAEATLESARRPASVDALLRMIGFDAAEHRQLSREALYRLWQARPDLLAADRAEGPRRIRRQERAVTLEDHATTLVAHPLVEQAHAWSRWTGAWERIEVAVICWNGEPLDQPLPAVAPPELARRLSRFLDEQGAEWRPPFGEALSVRRVLRDYLEARRLAGQEVVLRDAAAVGIVLGLRVTVADEHFRSEVEAAVRRELGDGPAGLFHPGRLAFGEDLYASDIYQALMALAGVRDVCLYRFKRAGRRYPDESRSGRIALSGLEFPVCDGDLARPARGHLRLDLKGGLRG